MKEDGQKAEGSKTFWMDISFHSRKKDSVINTLPLDLEQKYQTLAHNNNNKLQMYASKRCVHLAVFPHIF